METRFLVVSAAESGNSSEPSKDLSQIVFTQLWVGRIIFVEFSSPM